MKFNVGEIVKITKDLRSYPEEIFVILDDHMKGEDIYRVKSIKSGQRLAVHSSVMRYCADELLLDARRRARERMTRADSVPAR